MVTSSVSRRQRLRQQTLEEIHAVAVRQVADGGAEAVSLNAIAREMGMSGPGLYRYYASRDDLLGALIAAGYARLAAAVTDAESAGLPADERLRRVVHAYRDWAVANPRYYQLLFGVRPRGLGADSDETVGVLHGGMRVLEDVFVALVAPPEPESAPPADALDRELRIWSRDRDDPQGITPLALRLAVLAWTRLHGTVGLELTGALDRMGLDPALLLDDEVRRLVAEARAG